MTDPVSTTTPQEELPQAHAPYAARIQVHARKDPEKELDFIVGGAGNRRLWAPRELGDPAH